MRTRERMAVSRKGFGRRGGIGIGLRDAARMKLTAIVLGLLIALPCGMFCEDTFAGQRLVVAKPQELRSLLPKDARLLNDPVSIEQFLEALDGAPPSWGGLHGQQEARDDEKLFALNRERDRLRFERPALSERITFLWEGVLSSYVSEHAGFLVAIGPEMIPTRWGLVRFKPESLPAELAALPPTDIREFLRARVAGGENVRIVVAMTGRLVPEEALIYDFAHEEPGQGMIMPMVRVEQIDYFITP